MAKVITDEQNYYDIADAIRGKLEVETLYLPSEMAAAIEGIETGIDLTSEDEGKVVVEDEGSYVLAEQTSLSISQNGTYDTTTNDEVVVEVSGGGSQSGASLSYASTSADSTYNSSVGNYGYFSSATAIGMEKKNWWGAANKAQHWWMIEFEQAVRIDRIKFSNYWNISGSTWLSTDVTFQGGDGTSWTDLLTLTNLDQSETQREYQIQNNNSYTHYRFVCNNTGSTSYYTGFGKIQMYGVAAANLITKTITQNGTYDPADDNADGYSEVTVNVSGGGGSVSDNDLLFHFDTDMRNVGKAGAALINSTGMELSDEQSKFGTHSLKFLGTQTFKNFSLESALQLGTNDFTLDYWVYPTDLPSGSSSYSVPVCFDYRSHGMYLNQTKINYAFAKTSGAWLIDSIVNVTVPTNEWVHIAVVRDGASIYIFLNGTKITTANIGQDTIAPISYLTIGSNSYQSGDRRFSGYLDELRLKIGEAVWTDDFTPPTEPYDGSSGGGSATLISKTITENGTYDPADDNADGYNSVTVNVSGGGSSEYVEEWDLTESSEGKISGVPLTLNGITLDSSGATFDYDIDYIKVPFAWGGMTFEVDVVSMQLTSYAHRRFIMVDTGSGLIYRNSGKWAFYDGSGWVESSETDGSFFANSTVKVNIGSDGYWHIYKNDVLWWEPSRALKIQGGLMIGSSGQSINNAVISGIRILKP